MDANPAPRNQRELAEQITRRLLAVVPTSTVSLRGSLASGADDEFSDVDLVWVVPDGTVSSRADEVRAVLADVAEVASVRADPDLQRSAIRRLLFIRFAELPLFWRLDLDIRAECAAGDDEAGLDDQLARGTEWSLAESAAMNAIAAVKASRRCQRAKADSLLTRGFERIGARDSGGPIAARVVALAAAAADQEPGLDSLAARIVALAEVIRDESTT